MNNRVIFRAGKAVLDAGLAALRFNFRGAGASTGSFDEGKGEQQDVTAVTDWLEQRYPRLSLALVGFSFGAWVGLRVAAQDARFVACVGLGLPMNAYNFDFLLENRKASLYIVGADDEHCPREKLASFARRLPPSSEVQVIEGADHFFSLHLEQVQAMISEFFMKLSFQ